MSDARHLSILQNIRPQDIRTDPYPHVVVQNALPEALYCELEALLPPAGLLLEGREAKDTWFDYPACKVATNETIAPLWREFFAYHTSAAFFRELVGLFGEHLRQLHPDLERKLGGPLEGLGTMVRQTGAGENPANRSADVALECQFYTNYSRSPRVVRGPHVDRPTELFAALLYLRDPADPSSGGDLAVCRARDEKAVFPRARSVHIDMLPMEIRDAAVEVVETIRYAPNTLVLFLNSHRSVHAVTQRSPTEVPRRHINFCADVFRHADGGLFTLDLPAHLAAKRFLEHAPGLWRLANLIPNR